MQIKNTKIFYRAESKKLEIIRLKKLELKFSEKVHPSAIYKFRSLKSFVFKCSSKNSSKGMCYGMCYIRKLDMYRICKILIAKSLNEYIKFLL